MRWFLKTIVLAALVGWLSLTPGPVGDALRGTAAAPRTEVPPVDLQQELASLQSLVAAELHDLVDPWGRPYLFSVVDGAELLVWSAGPDGLPDTADDVYPE